MNRLGIWVLALSGGGPQQSRTMSIVQVGSEKLRVIDTGSAGPAIVFVHGNSLHIGSWEHQMAAGEFGDWRRIAVDLPGHGESAPSPEPDRRYSLRGYGETLKDLIEALSLDQVVLVGHSMGGHIAMEIAPEIPQVQGLFVFGAPPLRSLDDMGRGFLQSPLLRFIGAPQLGEAEAMEWAQGMVAAGSEPPAWVVSSIMSVDPKARPALGASLTPETMVDEVAALTKLSRPAAVAAGEREALVDISYLRELDAPLWRGGAQVIEGAGHSPQWERPAEFNALLRAYLDEIRG